jgi:hypothetical protein
MVRFAHEVARYTKTHIRYNFLISRKLQYPATLWSGGARYHNFYFTKKTKYVFLSCEQNAGQIQTYNSNIHFLNIYIYIFKIWIKYCRVRFTFTYCDSVGCNTGHLQSRYQHYKVKGCHLSCWKSLQSWRIRQYVPLKH